MAENGAGDQVNPQEGNQQDGGQDSNLEGRAALLVERPFAGAALGRWRPG